MLFFEQCLNFLIPPRCLMCDKIVLDAERVCADCFKQLHFIDKPYCSQCSRPFMSSVEAGRESICSECQESSVFWQNCRAAFVYNDGFKRLIMPLKYNDQYKSLRFISNFMYRSAQDLIDQADYIIPVPLHKKRLRYRQYNQSALLAWQLRQRGNITVLPMALLRVKETIILGHLNKAERQLVLQNAFVFNPKYEQRLKNKRVILIDDVMTTGSTIKECALTLLGAGVKHIDVLVAARVA
ncbi:ComF family protein [Commensalibacter nepenthis]|uniref:ComF family protein n=1 Tax=Commensalibacter nepenthis TaxID=3043872 RepID=A0ABT6Q898_9PROT|nr:ComF family protein [Commensalibacter sp. TBRC 10068]MDI2113009.1 ComF family protein [Commensalibacter sp. TBRC 10068]